MKQDKINEIINYLKFIEDNNFENTTQQRKINFKGDFKGDFKGFKVDLK
ncbi:hypothetical protein ACTFIT_004866 [Dictyostelium discoideum]